MSRVVAKSRKKEEVIPQTQKEDSQERLVTSWTDFYEGAAVKIVFEDGTSTSDTVDSIRKGTGGAMRVGFVPGSFLTGNAHNQSTWNIDGRPVAGVYILAIDRNRWTWK